MRKHLLQKLLLLAFAWLAGTTAWAQISISTAEQLADFINYHPTESGKLTKDITYSGGTLGNTDFKGILDGDGHTITLSVGSAETPATGDFALFKSTGEGAVIKNLNIAGGVYINNPQKVSKVAGLILNVNGATTIQNVNNNVNFNVTIDYYGNVNHRNAGFVAECSAALTVDNCVYRGTYTCIGENPHAFCAGFISYVGASGSFTFNNSTFSGNINCNLTSVSQVAEGPWEASGFVGWVEKHTSPTNLSFTNCTCSGNIIQYNQAQRIGGFVSTPVNDVNVNSWGVTYTMTNCTMSGVIKRWPLNKSEYRRLIYPYSNDSDDPDPKRGLILGGYWDLSSIIDVKNCKFTDATHVEKAPIDGFINPSICEKLGNHNYVPEQGWCDRCHKLITVTDTDGEYFHAGSQTQWNNAAIRFSYEKEELSTNVKLDCNITQNYVICGYDENNYYTGTFDGQGHTITLNIGSEDCKDDSWGTGRVSMFGGIKNATIQNCIFEGAITGTTNSAPIATYANGSTKNIFNNIVSKVYVKQTATNEQNCSNMIAVANSNVDFNNCLVAGTVDAKKDAGGFLGWAASKTINMTNCIMIGDVTISSGNSAVFLRISNQTAYNPNTVTMTNCFYKRCHATILAGNGANYDALDTHTTDDKDIASGKLCYAVNDNLNPNPFGQNLGESNKDTHPYPFNYNNEHPQVYYVGDYKYASFYDATKDWKLQGDAKANIVEIDGSIANLTAIDDVPKGTATIISGSYYNKLECTAQTEKAILNHNQLKGTATGLTPEGMAAAHPKCDKFYGLTLNASMEPESIGFYWKAANGGPFKVSANKTYLPRPRGAQPISAIRFRDGGETAIETLESAEEQLITDGPIYNLQGQRVSANAKGIVIKKGKKYFVK